MQPTLINGFTMSTDTIIGPWSSQGGTITQEQMDNANIIRSFFLNEGWTLNAICGMLGCMQGESTINPAFIQQTNRYRLPNSAASLSDVPNSVMKHFFKEYYQVTNRAFAIGLVQWDGYSNVQVLGGTEQQQKLVAYAIRNNINWYDGWTQLYRLRGEYAYDVTNGPTFFHPVTISGVRYTFVNYPFSTASADVLAEAWTVGYEVNSGGVGYRGQTALWWYNYFTDPSAPAVIPPQDFLTPLPADPDLPVPTDPTDPLPPGIGHIPGWLVAIFCRKRKELKRKCIRV